jgi:hypothetical protein
MIITDRIIQLLILIGQRLMINDDQALELSEADEINRLSFKDWFSVANTLSDNELVLLFKGIVLTEKTLKWRGGSVSGGIWIYKKITDRMLDPDYHLADWALKNTSNPYIPFGSLNGGARNVLEYFERQQRHVHKKEMEKISREKRLLENKITGLENTVKRLQRIISDHKGKHALEKLTGNELARQLLSDRTRSVYFYHDEIERLIIDKEVKKEYLVELLARFKEKERRNIKVLKQKLIEEIKTRR